MRMTAIAYGILVLALAAGCGAHKGPRPDQTAAEIAPLTIMGEAIDVADPTGGGGIAQPVVPEPQILPADVAMLPEIPTGDDDEDEDEGEDGTSLDEALDLVESAREAWSAGERDKAIEALDQAYAALLKTPGDRHDKELQQQREDLRFLISRRLTEIYATRFTMAKGTHKEIPPTVNDHVEREIRLFQTMERDFFLESYRRSGRYRDATKA